MIDDLPEDDTRPMPTRFKLGCPYCGLIGIGTEHQEVCPENPARKMSHAELIAMCEEHQRQLAKRDAALQAKQKELDDLGFEYADLKQWQRDAVKLLNLTTLGGPGSYCNVEKARLLSEVEGDE